MKKKKYSGLLAVVMIAAVAAWNVNLNSQKETLSDLSMENVEALASESALGDCKYNPWYYCCILTPSGEDCTPLHWAWF